MGRVISVVAPRVLLIGKSGPKQPVRTETRSDKRFIVEIVRMSKSTNTH